MKYPCTIIFLATLFGQTLAANSKLNQYASIDDCNADRNIISHASPAEGTCHSRDSRTNAVYLVVGSGAAGASFLARTEGDCKGDTLGGNLPTGSCIGLPDGTRGIQFGI